MRIYCNIDNGKTGDARVALIVCEMRDVNHRCQSPAPSTPVLAIDTNAGPIEIDVASGGGAPCYIDQYALVDAAKDLGCTPPQIREAVIAAYPQAAEWNWVCS